MLKFEFQAKSDAELKEKFSRLGGAEADELAANVVRTLTVQILGDAQTNLTKNGTSVSGQLMNSGRVSQPKITRKEISAEVKFASDHAWYVEFGRRAGKMPPVASLISWVKKRNLVSKEDTKTARAINARKTKYRHNLQGGIVKSYTKYKKKTRRTLSQDIASQQRNIAFLIARSIGRNGSKAQPFFYPAIEKNSKLLVDNFKQQYDEFINKVTR